MKETSIKKSVIIITTIVVVCKVLGFLKNSLLANFFGTSFIVDAYTMTFSIGLIMSGWVAGLIGGFTPIYKKVEVECDNDSNSVKRYSSNVFNWIYIISVVLIILLEIFASQLVDAVAPGFSDEAKVLTTRFFRIYSLGLLFYVGYRYFKEYLVCLKKSILATIPDLFISSLCILGIVLGYYIEIIWLIVSYVIAVGAQFLFELVSSILVGFRYKPFLKIDSNIKALLILFVPVFLSDMLAEINVLIDKIFASKLDEGVVSVLEYANTLKDFAYQIGTTALVLIVFPVLSKFWAEKKYDDFESLTIKSLNYMSAFFMPVVGFAFATSHRIIQIVYFRGAFDSAALIMSSRALMAYVFALLPLGYRVVFLKSFYSSRKSIYILICSLVNVSLNVGLNFLFVNMFGYFGLALSTSIAAALTMLPYLLIIRRILPSFSYKKFFIEGSKCLACSLLFTIPLFFFEHLFGFYPSSFAFNFLIIFGLFVISFVIYIFFAVRVFKVEEIKYLFDKFKNKLFHRKATNEN